MRWFLPYVMAFSLFQPAAAAEPRLRFIGQQIVATGASAEGTIVGGLSGIDYNPATGRYVAISDDRARRSPARFYDIAFSLTAQRFDGVRFTGVHFMRQPDSALFAAGGIDAEAIRFSAHGFFYASEGNARAEIAPFVREMRTDGSFLRSFAVPAHYMPGRAGGVRHNLAFESLAVSADDRSVLVATEDSLAQDSAARRHSARILSFDSMTGAPVAEYIYELEPESGVSTGLSELLALDDGRYLALERSAEPGPHGRSAKLFLIDLADASSVLSLNVLDHGDYRPVAKTLLLDIGALGIAADNIEGMTFGETLETGNRSLILISDNNFSNSQVTQFLAFEVLPAREHDPIMLAATGLDAPAR